MDVIRARRLLLKIQAFLDHDSHPELSRLERDLIKSYLLQLYEVVQDEDQPKDESISRISRVHEPVTRPKYEMPKQEPHVVQVKETIIDTPMVNIPEVTPQKPVEIPVEIIYPEPKIVTPSPRVEPQFYAPATEPVKEPVREPVKEVYEEPYQENNGEQTKENIYQPTVTPEYKHVNADDALTKLFEQQKSEDMPERFSHVPIASIESAIGLNERIFTLKELFGGDRELFDTTCAQLNNLSSFAEAKTLLLNGPARKYHWGDTERLKMAEQFIRIVQRRYPKHG